METGRHRFVRNALWLAAILPLLMALAGCRRNYGPFPIWVSDLSVDAKPIVGQVVTLTVEVESTEDEPNIEVTITLPDGIQLIEGDLTWHETLQANRPARRQLVICTVYPGHWRIFANVVSYRPEGNQYGDLETLRIETYRETPTFEVIITVESAPRPLPTQLPKDPTPTPAACHR
jgi:hypothetical protein